MSADSPTPLTDQKKSGITGFYTCATVPAELSAYLESRLRLATEAIRALTKDHSKGCECKGCAFLKELS